MTSILQLSRIDAKSEMLHLINIGVPIDYALANRAFSDILSIKDPTKRTYYITATLHGLMVGDASVEAITGILDACYFLDGYDPRKRPKIRSKKRIVAYVGSGKKGVKTVNISSLSAFVASCNGAAVAKYCSPSASSATGSQDFIEIIGADIHIPFEDMCTVLETVGVGYFGLETVVPRFANVYSGIFMAPHALSVALAGMTSLFQADRLIYGLAHPDVELSQKVFEHYDVPGVTVVNSTPDGVHYIDELSDAGVATILGYGDAKKQSELALRDITGSKDAALTLEAIGQVSDPRQNVVKGLQGLSGKNKILAKQLALNAALLLRESCDMDFVTAYSKSLEAIDSGEAVAKLKHFVELTGGDTARLQKLLRASEHDGANR